MKILLSPAKSLNLSPFDTPNAMLPKFQDEIGELVSIMKTKNVDNLRKMMGISESLAVENHVRYQSFSKDFNPKNSKPALFCFDGDVYTGLQARDFTDSDVTEAQSKIRILSGLYGLLRPLDLMQPYRLEMGVSLKTKKGSNLYHYWGDKITEELNQSLDEGELVVNLASEEYSKAVNFKKLKGRAVKVSFKDFKNGEAKVISFFAKKARGMMARHIIKNRINTIEGIIGAEIDGYLLDEVNSSERELVFLR